MLRTDEFDYALPPDLIASRPPERRDAARMLVVNRADGTIAHRAFTDFPAHLRDGDLVALNDTRVVPSRFFSEDGKIEVVRLDGAGARQWRCLVRPGRKMRLGATVRLGGATAEVTAILEGGERILHFDREVDIGHHGRLALPHYMGRESEDDDRERYQTVFARAEGAIAAPTAGLHFTPELVARLPHTFVTLHVGVGTFAPVKAELVADHRMHSERFDVSPAAAEALAAAPRIVAVGTTVARVLEHLHATRGRIVPGAGETDIFIHPPYRFGAVGALLTNFHLPKSTLLMLVSAFAGSALVREAYRQAVAENYRFFSYGDCMLVL